MNINEYVTALQKRFPEVGKRVIYDSSEKGEPFCELIYKNPHDRDFPLIFNICEDGGSISCSGIEKVTGEGRLSLEQLICAAEDIINDTVMFVFCYESDEKMENHRLYDSYVFALSEEGDSYNKFIEKINAPLNKISRIFTPLKGIFVVRNFSGSKSFEVRR